MNSDGSPKGPDCPLLLQAVLYPRTSHKLRKMVLVRLALELSEGLQGLCFQGDLSLISTQAPVHQPLWSSQQPREWNEAPPHSRRGNGGSGQ